MNEQATSSITPRGVAYLFAWEDEESLILEDFAAKKVFRINDRGEQKTLLIDTSRYGGGGGVPCQKGRYIVFMGRDPSSSSGAVNLWRLDALTSNISKLTTGFFDAGAGCSADGKWVYYSQPNEKQPKLQRVSIDGGSPSTVIEMFVFPDRFDVSRDGKLMAFRTMDTIGVIDLQVGGVKKKYLMDPRFGGSDGSVGSPQFTPDGKALAYVAHVNGVDNIWAQPLDGRLPHPLTHFKSDEIRDFHWSPSGKRLGIMRGRTESNVVLIRDAKP